VGFIYGDSQARLPEGIFQMQCIDVITNLQLRTARDFCIFLVFFVNTRRKGFRVFERKKRFWDLCDYWDKFVIFLSFKPYFATKWHRRWDTWFLLCDWD